MRRPIWCRYDNHLDNKLSEDIYDIVDRARELYPQIGTN